jgi:hypothetical protein
MPRVHRRAAALLAVAVLTTACSGAANDTSGSEPTLVLDAPRPEFHGAVAVEIAPTTVLVRILEGNCETGPGLYCDPDKELGYRPVGDPRPTTLTDATLDLDADGRYWLVTLEFDPARPVVAAGERVGELGGAVVVADAEQQVLVTALADDVVGGTVLVDGLEKPDAYALVTGLSDR